MLYANWQIGAGTGQDLRPLIRWMVFDQGVRIIISAPARPHTSLTSIWESSQVDEHSASM